MSQFSEYLADSAARMCIRIVTHRASAKDKAFEYNTRLMFDQFAAREEQTVIGHANKLIEIASR